MNATRHGVRKIVSGGQTGVDRAALDAAMALGLEHGGWCPRGRLAEDGVIATKYRLEELASPDYAARTRQNVIDSDGTLILYQSRLQGGTLLTHRIAKELGRPLQRVRLDRAIRYQRIVEWIVENRIQTLNIAGPRGSSHARLEQMAFEAVCNLFQFAETLPRFDSEE